MCRPKNSPDIFDLRSSLNRMQQYSTTCIPALPPPKLQIQSKKRREEARGWPRVQLLSSSGNSIGFL